MNNYKKKYKKDKKKKIAKILLYISNFIFYIF